MPNARYLRWIGLAVCLRFGFFCADFAYAQSPAVRWLQLDGATNARDAGGYPAATGTRMRWGTLFRSNQLGSLSATDCIKLKTVGIKTIIDLRTPLQVAASPDVSSVSDFAAYHHIPIGIDGDSWEEIYLNIINRYAPSLAQAFALLADSQNIPALVHCSAGKDRTGVFIALIQKLLHVPDETILSDYLLSNEKDMYVEKEWLEVVFARIHEEGGIEIFLLNRGIGHSIQQTVRRNFLQGESGIPPVRFQSFR